MNPIVRNILAVVAGCIIGGLINMALIMVGIQIFPLPEGIDIMDPDSLTQNFHLLETKHFIFPLLAHAIGTLVGGFTAAKIATNNKLKLALLVGAFFLIGGIMEIMAHAGPMWFNVLDLLGAYIPMAWLGAKWAKA
jgi:hypothetical protein